MTTSFVPPPGSNKYDFSDKTSYYVISKGEQEVDIVKTNKGDAKIKAGDTIKNIQKLTEEDLTAPNAIKLQNFTMQFKGYLEEKIKGKKFPVFNDMIQWVRLKISKKWGTLSKLNAIENDIERRFPGAKQINLQQQQDRVSKTASNVFAPKQDS